MEAFIRLFSDHYTAMVLDVVDAREWLNFRGFKDADISEYDWTSTEAKPATQTV
jgi:hypothetical protein